MNTLNELAREIFNQGYKAAQRVYKTLVDDFQEENARLHNQLRWRKWPDEKPDTSGVCLCLDYEFGRWKCQIARCVEDCWLINGHPALDGPEYWRPIDLPDHEANT